MGVRRLRQPLSLALIIVGGLLLADALTTLVWQEPVSALYSRLQQGRLDDKLATLEGTEPSAVDRRVLSRLGTLDRRLAYLSRALNRRSDDGDPLGRIRIPSIGMSQVVVEGTDTSSLRKGPGHYPRTPLPGTHGTVAIAGHRTTYGAPFRKIDQLDRGDRVELRMPYGTFLYAVERRRIVPPTAVWVTGRTSYDRLILSACHPLYSAAKRIVVFARLVDTRPKGDPVA